MGFLGFLGGFFLLPILQQGAHLGDQPCGPARLQHVAHDARRARALQLHSRERRLQGTAVQWVGGGGGGDVCGFISLTCFGQCCGSGSEIQCLFDPWIRGGKKIQIGNEQPGSYFREIRNNFLGLKYLNSLIRIRDRGWKKFGSGIRDKHPGSATLALG